MRLSRGDPMGIGFPHDYLIAYCGWRFAVILFRLE
jgi:hypothetical protein